MKKDSPKTAVQTWGRVLGPLKGIYITISLSCFPIIIYRGKKFNSMMPTSTWTPGGWNQKVDGAVSQLLPTSPEECPQVDHALLFDKTSYYPLQVGADSLGN